ncbi:hypothetical protein [Microbacterium sp.]|uniref:hypothetical protein n=1 Tax=Microbacterium sp. TaxID=51671 RepID=UPI003A863FBF
MPDLLRSAGGDAVARVGRLWGSALRAMHTHAVVAANPRPPRTLTRACVWATGQWPGVHEVIGDDGHAALRGWIADVRGPVKPVVVHGSPGMAHWTVAPDGSQAALLTGEDAGVADASYDTAWVLGELAEIFHFYPSAREGIVRLRQGFEEGYGALPDPDRIHIGIAFRLIQHAYDWHHYAGASPAEAGLLVRLAGTYLRTAPRRRGGQFL